MLLLCMISLMSALSISLILSASPLSMGFWVLLIALSASLFTGIMFNSWFAIVIFLIYIGGMLVMFAYFAALTPNQPLGLNLMFSMFMLTLMTIMSLSLIFMITSPNLLSIASFDMYNSITIMFTPYNYILIILLAAILLFILVAVVKIANISMGPLRPFIYV